MRITKKIWIINISLLIIVGIATIFIAQEHKSIAPSKPVIENWKNVNFPDNYRHSVNVMIPSDWYFDCCGDTGDFSVHTISRKKPNGELEETDAFIRITDYRLQGCPDGKNTCDFTERVKISPNQFASTLQKEFESLESDWGFVGKLTTPQFQNNVKIYDSKKDADESGDLYLIQTDTGVLTVIFSQNTLFTQEFKNDFLSRIYSR